MKYSGFLSGRIKKNPEDFIVKEKLKNTTLKEEFPYNLYLLRKKNWTTHDILIELGKENHVRLSEIHYAGRKDRYGITEQYISSKKNLKLPEKLKKNVELIFLGKIREAIKPRSLDSNEFIITIRKIQDKEIDKILNNIESVKKNGFINYYDSQRFLSYNMIYELPIFYFFRKDYESFIKYYLTNFYKTESRKARDRKYEIILNWKDWTKCYELSETKIEKRIFSELLKNNTDFKKLIAFLPPQEINFMISVFQSYIWNKTVFEYLKQVYKENLFYFKTRTGDLGFTPYPKKIMDSFPLIHHKVFYNKNYNEFFIKVLRNLNMEPDIFKSKIQIQNEKLAYSFRKIIEFPKNFEILEIDEDDNNRKKMKLKFELNSGVYATMLIKRILLRI